MEDANLTVARAYFSPVRVLVQRKGIILRGAIGIVRKTVCKHLSIRYGT